MAQLNAFGEKYDWSSITIGLLGASPTGVSALEYDKTQTKENVYGISNEPVGRGRGNKAYTGSITLHEDEIRAIEAAAGLNKDLTDIAPFGIVVVFTRPDGTVRTDYLEFCEFMQTGTSASQGATNLEKQITLVIGNIRKQ